MYCPGSKNVKPDALSQYFKVPAKDGILDTILRSEVFVNAIEMDIERVIRQAQGDDAAASNCPDGRLYVPAPAQSQVLQWGYSSQLSSHPGTGRTLSSGILKLCIRCIAFSKCSIFVLHFFNEICSID